MNVDPGYEGGGLGPTQPPPAPPVQQPPVDNPPTTSPPTGNTPDPTPTTGGSSSPANLPPLPDPSTWTGGVPNQALIDDLLEEGYSRSDIDAWRSAVIYYMGTHGTFTPVLPPDTTPPTGGGGGGGGGGSEPTPGPTDSYDIGYDLEAGVEPTDADYQGWQFDQDTVYDGTRQVADASAAAGHPAPGTVIGEPYQGTHSVASNQAAGSDNWQSENAVDVWLFPGTPILAVRDGVISPGGYGYGLMASTGRFAGSRLHLVSDAGPIFFYTHMRSLKAAKGARVKQGDVLGYSGIANGVPHLHFAVNPPYKPDVFAPLAYSLTSSPGDNPITQPINTAPTDDPTGPPLASSVEDAWDELTRFLGLTLPAAASHLKTARGDLAAAVS